MDSIIQTLVALFAALGAVTGSPAATGGLPDRPSIVAPTSSSDDVPSAKSGEIKGAIQSIKGNAIVVNGIQITLSSLTEVKGQLQVGALVQVEGAKQADGSLLARQVRVEDDKRIGDDKDNKGNGSGGSKPTDDSKKDDGKKDDNGKDGGKKDDNGKDSGKKDDNGKDGGKKDDNGKK